MTRKRTKQHSRTEFEMLIGGKTCKATFETDRGLITVTSHGEKYGTRTTQLGGFASNPEAFARILLREIVG